jgi:predicted transcriptional regulator
MRRGPKDMAGQVLEEILSTRNLAPTRIMARTGAGYIFLKVLIENGLVELQHGKKRNILHVTDKGHEFLEHYRICDSILPQCT